MRDRNAGFRKLGKNGRCVCCCVRAIRAFPVSAGELACGPVPRPVGIPSLATNTPRHCPHLLHSLRGALTRGAFCREQHSDDKLPESIGNAVRDVSVQQPGGGTFAKPRAFYPNDGCYDKDGEQAAGGASKAQGVAGLPVSGRSWKLECKRQSSIIAKNKLVRKSKAWEEKMNIKKKQETIKAKENALKQERIDEKREKRRVQLERKAQKEANLLKGAVVQAISTKTVKKMSRKQLRDVRKMDVHSNINPAPIEKTKGLNGKVKI